MATVLAPRQMLHRLRRRSTTVPSAGRVAARLARARQAMAALPHLRADRGTSWRLTYCASELEVAASLTALAGERNVVIDGSTTLGELAWALVDHGHLSSDAGMVVADVLFLTGSGSAGWVEDPRVEVSVAQVARHLAAHIDLRRTHG